MTAPSDLASLIDELVVAYNARDAAGFAALFSEDGVIATFAGAVEQAGRAAIAAHYARVFEERPQNHTVVVHRAVVGARVVDHERVQRHPDETPFDVVAIYTFAADRSAIARLDLVRP